MQVGGDSMATHMHILCPAARVHVAKDYKSLQIRKEETDMMNLLKRLWKEEQGQDLIEYALLVALVALAATAGMNALATSINSEFTTLGTDLTTAT